MKKNILFFMVIIILTILNVFLIAKENQLSQTTKRKIYELKVTVKELNSEKANLISIFSKIFTIESSVLFNDIKLKNEGNDKINLKSLFSTHPKLVLSIPEKVCNTCYADLFLELKKFSEDVPENSVVTIVPISKFREMKNLYKGYQMNMSIYGINNQKLSPVINNDLTPLIFITDSTLTCRNVFIPDQYNVQLTTNYLNIIKKKF